MAGKKREKLRMMLSVLAVLSIMFGMLGFLLSMASGFQQVARLEKQFPLHGLSGIAVDSRGNLYYGTSQYSAIQVYDNEGSFLYGFSFPTGGAGHFDFYIDKDDVIHVATARENAYLFRYGEHLETIVYANSAEMSAALDEHRAKSDNAKGFRDADGNTYLRGGFRSLEMCDASGKFVRNISPKSPIWPFSAPIFWCFAAGGMLTMFIVHRKALAKLAEETYLPEKRRRR